MILKRLEMNAFGPFKDKEVIDFESLSTNKIFLIYGKTGSGKSTIFDAISYALYGEMTGNYRKSTSVKSLYSTKESVCSVALTFEEKGVLYRVERTPKQFVYSAKAKKMIEKNSVANLYQISLDGTSKSLTNRSNEVTSKVIEIIGINHKQFTQVVVLPQGQFIDILNKKGSEREELLNALLRTDKFNLLTNKLKEAYDSLYSQISDVNSKIKGLLEVFGVSTKEELVELIDSLEPEYKIKEEQFNAISNEVLELSKEIEKINQNNKYLELFNKEDENYKKLMLDKSRIEILQESLDMIHKFEEITPIYALYNTSLDNIESTNTQLEKYEKDYLESKEEFDTISSKEENIDKIQKEYTLCNNKLQSLITLKDNYDSIDTITNQILKLRSDKNIIFSSLTRDEEIIKIEEYEIDKIEKENNSLQEFIDNNTNIEGEIEKRNTLVSGYLEYKNTEKDFLTLSKDVSIDKENLEKDTIEYEKLEENYKNQEQLYNHNELYKYHNLIQENEPCPLCGSKHHPNIIKLLEGAISKESLNALKNKLDNENERIIKLKAKIENQLINLKQHEIKLENSKFSGLDINILKSEIGELNSKLKEREDYQKRIKNNKETLSTRIVQLEKMKKKFIENNSELSNIEGKIETLKTKLDETKNLIISHVQNIESYPLVIKELENKLKITSKNKEQMEKELNYLKTKKMNLETSINVNQENLNKFLKDRELLESKLNLKLKEYHLTLEKYLIDNEKFTPKKKEYAEEITSYKINFNNSKNQLETYKNLIYSYEFLSVDEKQDELNICNKKLNEVKNEFTDIKSKITSMNQNHESIKKYEKSIENDMKRYNILERLYNLSSGKITGVQKMSLSKFVLSKLLEDMIIYANKYYYKFSLGRYKLMRNESIEASNSGLELDVIDSLNNSTRPVSSLSGGESFMAALALSLGMSECVSSLIGGISINMVFIDEGFGSLDDEHLDQALETLSTLSNGGLMIGIISHIDELKNRLQSKIEVMKTSYGSYIK